jgi:hypothetical protein
MPIKMFCVCFVAFALFTLHTSSVGGGGGAKSQVKQSYSIDVSFNSATTPALPNEPIAIAYGFAKWEGGSFKGKGQNLLKLKQGDDFYVNVFDTAPIPGQVAEILVSFEPFPNAKANSPFSDSAEMRLKGMNISTAVSGAASAGCNVIGTRWSAGAFKAQNPGRYKFTVTVTLQNGRVFQVDPEVDVMSE